MKGIIIDYGATIDSNGKHWSEVIWEGYCNCSLPVTKEQFREAYIYTERFLAFTPAIQPEYNFYELMQARVGIQLNYLLQQGALSEDILNTTLRVFSEGEVPIVEDLNDLTTHFADVIAGHCYDYARRCTMEAAPIIEHFCEKYDCALVSNFYGNLSAVLQDFGLLRCFRHVIDSAVVGVRKPDPEIFQLAIDKLGFPPKRSMPLATTSARTSSQPSSLVAKASGSRESAGTPKTMTLSTNQASPACSSSTIFCDISYSLLNIIPARTKCSAGIFLSLVL